jgi:pilus assembly protein FimV
MVINTGGAVAKLSLRALLVAAALLVPLAAQAAGLGKLTVLSNLGQPLRAEIDVVAVEKNEMDTLGVRLATIDSYLQNNLPYPSPALGLKLALEKRASGQPYIRATTVQPVNEPFVDVLVELTWNGGRILRAYTALLDPPTYTPEEPAVAAVPETPAPQQPSASMPAPEPQVQTQLGSEFQPAEEPAPVELPPLPEGAAQPPRTAAQAPSEMAPGEMAPGEMAPGEMVPGEMAPPPPAAMPAAPAMPPEEAGMAPELQVETHEVKRGDTLSEIALQYKPQDVSLEQMLVVLFRNNPEAFSGKNMNRLKTGPVLSLPDPSEAGAVDVQEARREVRVQVADWNAYKQRLAEATGMAAPMPDQAGQAAGGTITGPVEDTGAAAQAQAREVLRLSKGDTPGGSVAAQERIRNLEEELAAREKTIDEQNTRVAKLEKTIKDMQSLLDIKSKQGADLQSQATAPAGVAPAAPEPKPAMPSMPEPATPELPAAPAPQTMPAEPEMGAEPAPEAAAPPATTAEAKPKPKPARKPRVAASPPPPQSLVDQILNEPMYLGAGALVLALLGFLGFRIVKNRRAGAEEYEVGEEKKNSDVEPLTGTDTTGSMAAAARAAAAAQVTEEVDPLAEAEIYLAYGRDSQAEEILREALSSNPRRHEIHLKLLEIYAKRKDLAAFDPVARDLQVSTGGQGEVWLQVARLGYQLDPQNPRYLAGKPSGAAAAAVTAAAAATGLPALDEKLDFNIGLEDADTGTKTDIDLSRLGGAGGGTTTDIDLSSLGGPDETALPDVDLSTISGVPERTMQVPDVDFDIEAPADAATASGGVDFDFDLNAISAAPEPTSTQIMTKAMTQTVADVGEPGMGTIEFDLSKISLDVGDAGKMEPKLEFETPAGGMAPEMDLSSINLDLGGDQLGGGTDGPKDDRWYDVQTKFDLAKAYQEMGDREGAREILREVIAEGDDDQKAAAERVLETLA